MAKSRTGLSSLMTSARTPSKKGGIFAARVLLTMYDQTSNPYLFSKIGAWSSIGSIFFKKMTQQAGVAVDVNNIAKPLFPNFKNYPLKDEIVYVIALPDANAGEDPNDITYYYFQPINLWNSNHHNALPNPLINDTLPESQKQDYQQTIAGAVRRVTDGSTEIDLGNTFIERSNIKPLQSFEGDIIHEGRWGQSLRFGSTVNNSGVPNPWSVSGLNGDPITILRNNQYDDNKDPWIPQVEDINKDESSIYLTSTQKIPIEVSSKSYTSFDKGLEPKSPKEYSNPQIILNSGRLLFNSYDDSILLTSDDSINLNAQESVNMDAVEGVSISVGKNSEITLGSNDFGVIEPVILGDKFLADIENLANILFTLGNNFELIPMLTENNESNNELLDIGGNIKNAAQKILNNIDNYKSKTTFSK
jgi:hypothetical protein